MSNIFEYLCLGIFVFISIGFILFLDYRESKQVKEVIEHSENFIVYQECFELNDKYYCRIEE